MLRFGPWRFSTLAATLSAILATTMGRLPSRVASHFDGAPGR